MNLSKVFSRLELPLLKRELIENSQRKRTYILRVLMAVVLMLILLVFYSIEIMQAQTVLGIIGRGRELALVLLITDLVAIYALLPAMACSAISTEREKQTLALILISRIGPGTLVAEKFLSRLVPMLALLMITSPMLAVSYVLGGLSTEALAVCLLTLLTAAVQVNSAAIFCSCLFRTALEAFWGTYLLLAAMALGPLLLHTMDLMPEFVLFSRLGTDQAAGLFVLFLAAGGESVASVSSFSEVAVTTIPPLCMAALMLFTSRMLISQFRIDAPLDSRLLVRKFSHFSRMIWRAARWPFHALVVFLNRIAGISRVSTAFGPGKTAAGARRSLPVSRPVAWRELSISALTNWRMYAVVVPILLFFEFCVLQQEPMSTYARDEVTVFVDIAAVIVALLLMIGVTCRTFASERERQTLDLLLTTPLTNREILDEKLAAANRLRWLLLVPLLCFGIVHLFAGQVISWQSPRNSTQYVDDNFERIEVAVLSSVWLRECVRSLFGMLTHAFVYLTIAKWTAVYFSLRLNSIMKSLLGTLLSLIVLCVVPIVLCAIPLILTDVEPAAFPPFFFLSPIVIPVFNEFHDFTVVYRSRIWPASAYSVLLFNLLIYGGLALLLRMFVRRRLPWLLNRRDADAPTRTRADS